MQKAEWLKGLKRFEEVSEAKAVGQLFSSLLPYALFFALMLLAASRGWPGWIIAVLCLPASGFLVRIFILLHDAGHYAFSDSHRVNAMIGYACGILTFTSFPDFRRSHAVHHATVGNLDKRGEGDVWTMTTEEYRASSPFRRFLYRLVRTPAILFLLLAPLNFLVLNRIPHEWKHRADVLGTLFTDAVIAAIVAIAWLTVGIGPYLAVQLPIMYVASIAGTWLFYVQHQFKGVYWVRDKEWNQVEASLLGSSFYNLPSVLRFFTGNIGYHHIHHLDPRIPNYMLKACYEAVPEARLVHPLGFLEGFASLGLHLYDEGRGSLVSFRSYRKEGLGKVPS